MKPVRFYCQTIQRDQPGFYIFAERTDITYRTMSRYFGHTTISTLGPELLPVLVLDEIRRMEKQLMNPNGSGE